MINVTDLGMELDYMDIDCKQGYAVAIVVLRRNYMQKQPFEHVFKCSSFEDFKVFVRNSSLRPYTWPPQIPTVKSFAKIVESEKLLAIVTKLFALDVCVGHGYASGDGVYHRKAPSCRLTFLLKMKCFLEVFWNLKKIIFWTPTRKVVSLESLSLKSLFITFVSLLSRKVYCVGRTSHSL